MEKDSFPSTEVADVLNNNFIPIKLGKEEDVLATFEKGRVKVDQKMFISIINYFQVVHRTSHIHHRHHKSFILQKYLSPNEVGKSGVYLHSVVLSACFLFAGNGRQGQQRFLFKKRT